jgi:hypothetical protein
MLRREGLVLPVEGAWMFDGSSGFRGGLRDWEGIREIAGGLLGLESPPARDLDDEMSAFLDSMRDEDDEDDEDDVEDDVQSGQRGGSSLSREEVDSLTPEEVVAKIGTTNTRIAMCWFHVAQAIRQHGDLLPRGKVDMGKMFHHTRSRSSPTWARVWSTVRGKLFAMTGRIARTRTTWTPICAAASTASLQTSSARHC